MQIEVAVVPDCACPRFALARPTLRPAGTGLGTAARTRALPQRGKDCPLAVNHARRCAAIAPTIRRTLRTFTCMLVLDTGVFGIEVRVTRTSWVLLAAGGSVALLAGAFVFQAMGYPPCALCLWQRWPHGAAIAIGGLALILPHAVLPLAGAVAALTTAAVGLYHTGVERTWWDGPTTCSALPPGQLSPQELMEQIMTAPLVRCDEVAWSMAGLSMASWNAILSVALAALWLAAATSARRAP